MAVQFSYTVKARLGGTFDESDEIADEAEGVARAYDRMWGELQELVLRGSQEEFKACFEVVVEECEPLPEVCHNCGAKMGVWKGEPVMRCSECDAPHTMSVDALEEHP